MGKRYSLRLNGDFMRERGFAKRRSIKRYPVVDLASKSNSSFRLQNKRLPSANW